MLKFSFRSFRNNTSSRPRQARLVSSLPRTLFSGRHRRSVNRQSPQQLALAPQTEGLEPRILLTHLDLNVNSKPTAGVYDENAVNTNTVDVVAPGSNISVAEFATLVADAFAEDHGGVIDGSVLGAYHAFGAGHSKVITVLPTSGTNWGAGNGYHISGTGGFASTSEGGYDFTSLRFGTIEGGALGEAVVAFGVTALSITNRDYGNVTVTARLASGGALSAVSPIFAPTGQGDTFFGFEAPEGDSITGFSLRYDGDITGTPDVRLWFDDVGFVTAVPGATSQPPEATADAYTIDEDGFINIALPGVLANDTDPDGDTLTAHLVSGPANAAAFNLREDGSFFYIPDPNYFGDDSFTYVASDGDDESEVTTVSITINPINDAPFVDSPVVTTDEDTVIGGQVESFEAENDPYTFTLESDATHGIAVISPDGTYTYTPNANFHGTDSFVFRATDDQGASRIGMVTVKVRPVNDAPIVRDDTYSVDEDNTLTLSVAPIFRFVMDSAPGEFIGQGQSYSYTDATVDFDADTNFDNGVSLSVVQSNFAGDSWFLDFAAPSDRPLTPGVYEEAMRFAFQDPDRPGLDVSGNGRGHNELTGEFTIYDVEYGAGDIIDRFAASFIQQGLDRDGTPGPPLTGIIQYNTTIGTSGGVLANDEDVDGDLFTAILVNGPSNGTLSLNPDGTLRYTPDDDFTGTDSFTYKANDGRLDSEIATVTITVNGVDDAPLAVGQTLSTDEDVPLSGAVGGNDIDGDDLTFAVATTPAHGTLELAEDGSFTYTPEPDYFGTDSFTFTANDGMTDSDIAIVDITISPVNDAPIAGSDSYRTDEGTMLVVGRPGVLGNDTDVEVDGLSAVVVSGPANGILMLNPDGSFTYTPFAGFTGTDSFSYVANDGSDDSAPAAVTITVNETEAVNSPPTIVVPGTQTTAEDGPKVIFGISVDDADLNGSTGELRVTLSVKSGTLTVSTESAGGLSAGQITGNESGTVVLQGPLAAINATLSAGVTYLGAVDFNGRDMLKVTANDLGNTGAGGPLSAADTVKIHVLSPRAQIDDLFQSIQDLKSDRILNRGQANALVAKLKQVETKLDRGQEQVALNQLDTFTNHVRALIQGGVLTSETGQRLLNAAEDLQTSIEIEKENPFDRIFADCHLLDALWDFLSGYGKSGRSHRAWWR